MPIMDLLNTRNKNMISLLIISFGRCQEVLETFACVNKYHGKKIELFSLIIIQQESWKQLYLLL